MGATVIRTSGSERAICGRASMCDWIFAGVSPPGALSAPKGEWPCTEAPSAADHVELPRLVRPKGCFDTSAEWS